MSARVRTPSPDRVLRPRPVKPSNPAVLRAQRPGDTLHPSEPPDSGVSSGRSTPVPPDAPPSVHSLSSAKKQARAHAKHRMFHTIKYEPRVSHFDRASSHKNFEGFFVLFWISLFILVLTTALRNIKDTGFPVRMRVWSILAENVVDMGLSDGAMVLSSGLCLPLHHLYRRGGIFRWSRGGFWIQSVFQAAWLWLWIQWPFLLGWTWTAQVFFTLHTLVFFMKLHSYAFYNGHLSETERRLRALDRPETASLTAAVRYPSSPSRLHELSQDSDEETEKKVDGQQEHLTSLRSDLAEELTSPLGHITYPQNLTTWNFCDFVLCPTLCYELEYPRTSEFRWLELFWKALAVFGCIFLIIITSEDFVVPVLAESSLRLQTVSRLSDKGIILAETISMLLFPFMVLFLIIFLVIFEYLLGAFAEIARFADRRFYSDWWNSSDWLEFSREWNIPVHHFLRRHVYFASRAYFSNGVAMFITFLVSAFGHELIMGCITKKLRGYGLVAMMLQLPLVAVQRSKYVRGRWVFNNATFWASMVLGLSLLCSLYVLY